MTEDLKKDYITFLGDHIYNIQQIKDKTILDDPRFAYDKQLLELFSSTSPDSTIDNTKLEAFMKRPEGWKIASMVIDQQVLFKQFALGAQIESLPKNIRSDTLTQIQNIYLDKNRGKLNKFFKEKLQLRKRDGTGLMDDGAMLHLMTPDTAYIRNMFLLAEHDANLAEYITATTGLDPRAFQNGPDGLMRKPNWIDTSSRDVNELGLELLANYQLKDRFLDELGVPTDVRDASYVSSLVQRVDGRSPKVNLRYQKDIMDALDPNSGGIRTIPGRATPDLQGNMNRFIEAQSKVAQDYLKAYMERGKDPNEDDRKAVEALQAEARPVISVLNEKIQARAEGGEVQRRKKQELEQENTALESEKSTIVSELERFIPLEDQRKDQQETITRLEKPPFNLTGLTPDMLPSDLKTIIDSEILNLKNQLQNGTKTGIEDEYLKIQKEFDDVYNAEYRTRMTAEKAVTKKGEVSEARTEELMQQALRIARQTHGYELDQKKQLYDAIMSEIRGLEEQYNTYRQNDENIQQAEKEIRGRAPKELELMRSELDFYKAAPGATIDENNLRTLTVEELIDLAKDPPYNEPYSTSEERQNLRNKVLRAKTESFAIQTETVDPDYENIVGVGKPMTPEDLLRKSRSELIALITANYGGLITGGVTAVDLLEKATAATHKKLLSRYRISLREREKYIDERIASNNKAIENIDLQPETNKLKVTQDALRRYGYIMEKAGLIASNDAVRDKLTDTTAVDPADMTYTEEEKRVVAAHGVDAPKGYFELLNLFFADAEKQGDTGDSTETEKKAITGYMQSADRDAYFTKISEVMPPDKLRDLLGEGLGTTPATLADALTEMRARIAAGTLDQAGLRKIFTTITDRMQAEAIALP